MLSRFAVVVATLLWFACPSIVSAQKYGELLSNEWRKVLGISKDDGEYRWFGLPVDNFGVLTTYRPFAGDHFIDSDRICATWSCIEQTAPVHSVPDALSASGLETLLTVNGFADKGTGGSISLTAKEQKSLLASLILPQLANLLDLSSSANWSNNVTITLTIGTIYKRSVNMDRFKNFIKNQSTNTTLKEVFNGGTLVYIGADVVAQNLSVTITIDEQKNASASANLKKAASLLASGSSASVSLADGGNGTFTMRIPSFAVLAVQSRTQWKPGELFGSPEELQEKKREFDEMTKIIPMPKYDPHTLLPVANEAGH